MQSGGWGRPPLDEFGNPRFGDWSKAQEDLARKAQVDDSLWGEPTIVDDYDEEMNEADVASTNGGTSTPGLATPFLAGHQTPMNGIYRQ